MAITDKKISIIYPGRDISSLSDRPNEDGMKAPDLKARFDQLGKEVIPKLNALIDELFADLYSGTSQDGHTHDLDNLVDGITYKLFTALERAKLSAIEENAEVNQNAFSNVKVGSSTIASSAKTDTFELVEGLNIVMTVDALTKKITLNAVGDIATEAVQSMITDIGEYFTSINVEGALQEVGLSLLNKVDKVEGKGLSTEDYTSTEKTKLSGIAENANNYVHPNTHAPSIIEQDENNRFVTDAEKITWNAKQGALVSGTNIKTINGNSVLGSGDLVIATSSDWNAINATLTYASADSPTFVANTSIDLTSMISVGMKIKLTQATIKYFIVTAITSTTITLYGGTDYTLANATITLPYFSSMKAPFGFPMNPEKWSVVYLTLAKASVVSPGTTYKQAGSAQLSIPIGAYYVSWSACSRYARNASPVVGGYTSLSTATNSETHQKLTKFNYFNDSVSNNKDLYTSNYAEDKIILGTKTLFYMIMKSLDASPIALELVDFQPIIITAVCAYL